MFVAVFFFLVSPLFFQRVKDGIISFDSNSIIIELVINGDNPNANNENPDKSEPVSISYNDKPVTWSKNWIFTLDTNILLPSKNINKHANVNIICLKRLDLKNDLILLKKEKFFTVLSFFLFFLFNIIAANS